MYKTTLKTTTMKESKINSLKTQTIHFFSRSHEKICVDPIKSPQAWKVNDIKPDEGCFHVFSKNELDEIEHFVNDKNIDPHLYPRLKQLASIITNEITKGRGFFLISGFPIQKYSLKQTEHFYKELGKLIGTIGAQNEKGDLLGHVIDRNLKSNNVRKCENSKKIAFHFDFAYKVSLMCYNKAKAGGESLISSSVAIYNEIIKLKPHLIKRLYEPFYMDTHGQGKIYYLPIVPCRYFNGQLKTFYHSDYFRSVEKYSFFKGIDKDGKELLDLFDELAVSNEFAYRMELNPGDIQFVSNHTIIHARTRYEDYEEIEKRRHLLRLWISLNRKGNFKEGFLIAKEKVKFISTIIKHKLKFRNSKFDN